MSRLIELVAEASTARISTRGAELHAWSARGCDLLWSRDPAWWENSAPVLFPIVGWARNGEIKVDGKARPMGVHGFAAASEFTVERQTMREARLTLRATEATYAAYPFQFCLGVSYQLEADRLLVHVSVSNDGDRPMPFACGLHPAFKWPLADTRRDQHAVVFEREESGEVPVIAKGGLIGRARRTLPMRGRILPLNDELLSLEALCFLNAKSRWLRFDSGVGPGITVEAKNFPHWALWSKPGAPFLCIETWTGHGDPEEFDGELAEKPSMRILEPGSTDNSAAIFCYHEADAHRM